MSIASTEDVVSPRRYSVKGQDRYATSPRKSTVSECIETYKSLKNYISSLKDVDEQTVNFIRGIMPNYEVYKSALEYIYSLSHMTAEVSKTESSFGIAIKVNTEKSSLEATGHIMGKTLLDLGKFRENLRCKDSETQKEELLYLHTRVQQDHQELVRALQSSICCYWSLGTSTIQNLDNTLKQEKVHLKPEVIKISSTKRRPRNFFGSPLEYGCEPLPPILEKFFYYLEKYHAHEKGVWTEQPSAFHYKKMMDLVEKGTTFTKILMMDFDGKGTILASILKHFAKTLPESLLTRKLYLDFVAAGKNTDSMQRAISAQELIDQLPSRNKIVFGRYIRFLDKLNKQANSNGLTLEVISSTFAGCLMMVINPDSFKDIQFIAKVIEVIIPLVNEIFPSTTYKETFKPDTHFSTMMDQWYLGTQKSRKIFDVPLKEMHILYLPEVVERTMVFIERYYIKEEGLFVKKGDEETSKNLIKAIDRGTPFLKLWTAPVVNSTRIPHTLCDVLKKFIFSLHENLLEFKYPDFVKAAEINREKHRFETFKALIPELSTVNRNFLARYMRFFKKILTYKETKVTAEDLADEFGKAITDDITLFPKSKEEIRKHPSVRITYFLILNANMYFPPHEYPETKFNDDIEEEKKIIKSIRAAEEKRLLEEINKKTKRERKVKTFGISLNATETPIPEILEKLMCVIEKYYLAEEGLFRIPAHLSSQRALIENIEMGMTIKELLEASFVNRAHTLCGTLKEFLRQLPEPLFDAEKIDVFLEACKLRDVDEKTLKLKTLVETHVSENGRILLARWMRLFERIIKFTEKNKMTASSLAICLSMNLVHIPDPTLTMVIAPKINRMFENIILYSEKIFPASSYKENKFDDIIDPLMEQDEFLPLLVVDENEPFVTMYCGLYEGNADEYDETEHKTLEERLESLKISQNDDQEILDFLMSDEVPSQDEKLSAQDEMDKYLFGEKPVEKKPEVKDKPIDKEPDVKEKPIVPPLTPTETVVEIVDDIPLRGDMKRTNRTATIQPTPESRAHSKSRPELPSFIKEKQESPRTPPIGTKDKDPPKEVVKEVLQPMPGVQGPPRPVSRGKPETPKSDTKPKTVLWHNKGANSSRDGNREEKIELEHQNLSRPKTQKSKPRTVKSVTGNLNELEKEREKDVLDPFTVKVEPVVVEKVEVKTKVEPKVETKTGGLFGFGKVSTPVKPSPGTPVKKEEPKKEEKVVTPVTPVQQKPTIPIKPVTTPLEETKPPLPGSKPPIPIKPTVNPFKNDEDQQKPSTPTPQQKPLNPFLAKKEGTSQSFTSGGRIELPSRVDNTKKEEEDKRGSGSTNRFVELKKVDDESKRGSGGLFGPKVDSPAPQDLKKEDDDKKGLLRGTMGSGSSNNFKSNGEKPSFTKVGKIKKQLNTMSLDDTVLKGIAQIMSGPGTVIDFKERKGTQKTCTAFEMVEWLLWSYNITRKEAMKVGTLFAQKGMIVPVGEDTIFMDSNDSIWTFAN